MEKESLHNEENYFLAKWLANEITDDDLKNHVSAEDFVAYKKMQKGIDVFEALEAPMDESFLKIKDQLSNKKKGKVIQLNTKWITAIAASVVLLIVSYVGFSNKDIIINTDFGKQKTFALLDGSEVNLNAKSTITYNKNKWEGKRELSLEGEAFFKVKKGSIFTVNTTSGSITVVGTQFNIKASDSYFEVICYEGKVEVISGSETILLQQGDGVRKIDSSNLEKLKQTLKNPTWLTGESSYHKVPLKVVINELEQQFGVEFDKALIDENMIYTGSFDNKDLNIALASVFKPMGINYKSTGNNKIELR